jgi:hypothetical protein
LDADQSVEMAVEAGIVRRHGSGPRRVLAECLRYQFGFAPSGDRGAIRRAVWSLAAEFFADLTVNFGGDEDATAGFRREIDKSGEPAGVIGLGEGETTKSGLMDTFRRTANGSGWKIEPRGGDVTAVMVRIFAGVASDVGELEGDAEVDGMPGGGGLGRTEDAGHHESDRAGHAVAVAEEGGFVRDLRWTRVVAKGPGEGDGGGRIGVFESQTKRGEGVRAVARFEGGGDGFDLRGVAGFIGEVIESPAESVELGGGLAAVGREKLTGQVETLAGAGEEFFG